MTDFPEMTIATDRVDAEMVDHPRRWDIRAIRRFMITFGIVSSVFDYLTFGALLLLLHANQIQFRTGWFLESVVSASLIVLVIRSRKPFFRSRPGRHLLLATLGVVALTLVLPLTPLGRLFGFCPLPLPILLAIVLIVALYIVATEFVKVMYYRKMKF
jgi:Mg2+-importing ATPase